jgi:hypothetical protein
MVLALKKVESDSKVTILILLFKAVFLNRCAATAKCVVDFFNVTPKVSKNNTVWSFSISRCTTKHFFQVSM